MSKKQASALIDRAAAICGSRRALAKKLGITSQAFSQWQHIPHMRVLKIEQVTGISRHELRPDLYPVERRAS